MYVLASMLQDLKAAQQQPRCHVDTSMITPRGGRHRRSLAENLGAGIAGAAASAAANCEFTVVQAMVNEVTAACCGPDQCAGGIPPTCSLECAEAYSGFYYAECMQGVDTGKAMNAFGELCLDLDISSVALALRAKHGDLADIGMHDMAAIEAAVPEPFTINFDANEQGQIQDGGHDMYDGGNRISTSLCPATPTSGWITPYTDDLQVVQSDCFGTGGSYRMDLGGAMMILLSENTAGGAGSHIMDYLPTRWPYSPRVVVQYAPRASNSPNHLGLCALQFPSPSPWRATSARTAAAITSTPTSSPASSPAT